MTRSTSVTAIAEAFDDLALLLGLAELVARAPRDDVAPVLDERLEHLLDVRGPQGAPRDGEVDDAERRLEVGLPVEVVDDHLRDDVLFQFDDEADAVAVALVTHLADALELLLADELRDVRGHRALLTW